MNKILSPLSFTRGPVMKNRFMLAPLTNSQSHEDGVMSEEEFNWLTMRAKGGFGLTMTCASHVQAIGKGFPGQMGVFSDDHLEGLTRLATEINDQDILYGGKFYPTPPQQIIFNYSPKDLLPKQIPNVMCDGYWEVKTNGVNVLT